MSLRGVALCAHYGLVERPGRCPKCHGCLILTIYVRPENGNPQFRWACEKNTFHHRVCLKGIGPLKQVSSNSWMAFWNLMMLLRLNLPLHKAYSDIRAAWGNTDVKTFRAWKKTYQQHLMVANEELELLKIGSPKEVVVCDETMVGVHPEDGFESFQHKGVSKSSPRTRTSSQSRPKIRQKILKRLPAQTIHRKPASKQLRPVKKRPAGKAGTSKDGRSNGRWLWAAVTVGKGNTRFTHGNRRKRLAFRFLPRASEALDEKPKGVAEIRKTLRSHIHKDSILVFDGWKPTEQAADLENFDHVPPIIHNIEFRDRETGFHSNDIESENKRLKQWSRVRNSMLRLTELDLHEYTYYINGGSTVTDIMKGLSIAGGGGGKAMLVKL